jgi:SDR family mycofactocin-dependent oxidoreductase
MGRVEGKVALITGAARGQGRSHALRLASEGAQIIAVDSCEQVGTAPYAGATPEDLEESVRLIEKLDQRVVAVQADVRDSAQLDAAVQQGLEEFGHIDIVCANAGFNSFSKTWEMEETLWTEMMDICLTGVWRTVKATIPTMIEQGRGGSIVMTSSIFGLSGAANCSHYTAAKHGVVGLMRSLVNEVSEYGIRVNCVNPTTVNTDMFHNEPTYKLFCPDLENPTWEDCAERMQNLTALGVACVEPEDVSNAVLWLASNESRYVTGITLPVDAGFLTKTS